MDMMNNFKIGDEVWSNTPNTLRNTLGEEEGFYGKLLEIDNNRLSIYKVSVDMSKYRKYTGSDYYIGGKKYVWCKEIKLVNIEQVYELWS